MITIDFFQGLEISNEQSQYRCAVKIVLLEQKPFWQVECKVIAYENNDTYERREMLKGTGED